MVRNVVLAVFALGLGCRGKVPAPTPTEQAGPTDEPAARGEIDGMPLVPRAGVLATIGDVELDRAAFDELYQLKASKHGDAVPPRAAARYRRSLVKRLVYQEILRQEAAVVGVDGVDTVAWVDEQKRGVVNWEAHLARRGETEASLAATHRAEALERHIADAQGLLRVTPADIAAEYERIKDSFSAPRARVRAAHVVVDTMPDARALRRELIAPGADFETVVRQHEAWVPDVGVFTPSEEAKAFSDAVATLKVGEVSPPFAGGTGVHLVELLARYEPGPLPLVAVEESVRARLHEQRLAAAREALRPALHARYKPTIHLPELQELSSASQQ